MNRLPSAFTNLLLLPVFLSATLATYAQKPAYVLVSAPLAVSQKTDVPGHTLEPGSYSIRIVDHLKDRFIVQVEDASGTPLATFIGLHNPDFASFVALKQHGPIFWTAAPKGATALRGFSFPNGNTLEFVYPKDQAVTLAKLNTSSVPAIDPESEGRKPDPKLSPEDREVVTLWMLKATRVGPKDGTPAIEAKRFVAPVEPIAAPVQTASTALPAPPQAKSARPAPVQSGSVQIAKADPAEAPRVHAAVKKLPQTASDLPLVLLCSLLLLSTAGGLRLARGGARNRA